MTADPIVGRVASYLAEGREPVLSAYLFGSHAEGRAHRDSDVDIGVLFDERVLCTRSQRADAAIALTSALIAATHENRIDMVVLNDAPCELSAHILRGGVRLVCVDAELEHAFVRNTLLRAADMRPFLRRMRAIKLAAIRG